MAGRYSYGTQITYSCNSGYYKSSGSGSRTCQEGGTWNGNPAVCKIGNAFSGRSRIFPRRGRQLSGEGGAPGYNFIKISRKLHEIKENSVPRGEGASLRPPFRSATGPFYPTSLCYVII